MCFNLLIHTIFVKTNDITSSLSIIPTEKIVERLRNESPWCINKRIPEAFSTMSKRLYFSLFYPYAIEKNVRRALVLMGPRRARKQSCYSIASKNY